MKLSLSWHFCLYKEKKKPPVQSRNLDYGVLSLGTVPPLLGTGAEEKTQCIEIGISWFFILHISWPSSK
jgi:hypothetical protein